MNSVTGGDSTLASRLPGHPAFEVKEFSTYTVKDDRGLTKVYNPLWKA